ncbi:MAG: Holliday junction resolvase RuvX [Candidatus Aminicenantes bacterium]|nr:Holliday junction resolvase RuvX [Candidatus Aminicenantes bacterium]
MRILAIDFGDVHIGLALSDPLLLTAQPLGQYHLRTDTENDAFFRELIRRHQVAEIVVGLPLRMDGSPGRRVDKTREFAARLEKISGIKIVLWDERLTTRQAAGIMHEQKIKTKVKRRVEHQISAAIILQAYLDSRRLNSHDPQDH